MSNHQTAGDGKFVMSKLPPELRNRLKVEGGQAGLKPSADPVLETPNGVEDGRGSDKEVAVRPTR